MDTTTLYDSTAKSPEKHTQQLPQDKSHITQSHTIEVGKLGRAVGLKGALVFHLMSDFAEFIQAGTMLVAHKPSRTLIVKSITKRHSSMLITFEGVDSREKAQELVNMRLFTSEQETRAKCPLKKDEFFYFDIIGLAVIEAGEVLGKVIDIERIGTTDYLLIKQDSQAQSHTSTKPSKATKKKSKIFYIPYIDTYVLTITLASPTQSGGVFTQNAKSLCE
ncbi:ribosome maturation factor RimM [Helicobacter canis]|uniref:Ribosome maturation factor RimM n=1 Tax=Helicobacter canis NCTC 12740 TaxID=1357399 RepID=V8CJS1_9HELI|nr:ribosome maturation factor RimM [Helicobacter canis]ETD27280.1 16S rRNA processing protein RimM [Helicobacter canis NCTC 12740]